MSSEPRVEIENERGPDWAHKRRLASRRYVMVGAAIGVLFCFITLMVLYVLNAMRVLEPYIMYAGGFVVGFVCVYPASKGTCRQHPAGPISISMGLAGGAATVLLFMSINSSTRLARSHTLSMCAVSVIGLVVGGYFGGHKGLRENLGRKQRGIGATCASCGYDLRNSPPQVPCPECNGVLRYEWSPDSLHV